MDAGGRTSIAENLRTSTVQRPPMLSRPVRYAAACLAALLGALVQYAILPEPTLAPFVLFYLAVGVASWLGGRGPGLVATLLSAILGNVFFIAPSGAVSLSGPSLLVTLLFMGTAAAIAALCGSLRTAMEQTAEKSRLAHKALARQKSVELALRSSEERFRRVFESNMIAVSFWRVDGQCLEANQAFCELVGYAPDEVQAGLLRWPEVTPPEWRARDREAFEELKERGVCTPYRKQFVRRDGGRVDVVLGGALVGSAAEPMVAFALDVSDQKRMEEALREADRRKDDFLGVLSHELRNPLAPIRNSVYLLNRSVLDDRGRRAAAVIDRQATQLSRLVDDLLDVTRIARGKVQLHRTRLDLAEIIRQAVEDQRVQFSSSRVELEAQLTPGPIWVDGDAARLVQATDNLLHNARKFTPAGGRVRLSLARDDSGHAVIEVVDNGVGIDAATRARLFQPFVQGDRSLDRGGGGLGLGLALVKGLIELHGGQVDVFSAGPGQGTRFTLELPVLGAETRAAPLPGIRDLQQPGGAAPRRVLVVEDNEDAADSLREVLEIAGHQVAVAHDGLEGLAKARELKPQVILCDIGLPVMDGYTLARALRRDAALSSTFLVALTGYARPEDVRRAHEAGFDRHLAKPPALESLDRVLAETPDRDPAASAARSGS